MSPGWTGCPGLQSFTSQWSMSLLGKDHALISSPQCPAELLAHTVRQGAWGIGMTVRMDDVGPAGWDPGVGQNSETQVSTGGGDRSSRVKQPPVGWNGPGEYDGPLMLRQTLRQQGFLTFPLPRGYEQSLDDQGQDGLLARPSPTLRIKCVCCPSMDFHLTPSSSPHS